MDFQKDVTNTVKSEDLDQITRAGKTAAALLTKAKDWLRPGINKLQICEKIEQAIRKTDVDLKNTFIIGDSVRDIEAGKRMGMKTIFVLSGKTPLSETENWPIQPDCIKKDLLEAVEWILEAKKGDNAK